MDDLWMIFLHPKNPLPVKLTAWVWMPAGHMDTPWKPAQRLQDVMIPNGDLQQVCRVSLTPSQVTRTFSQEVSQAPEVHIAVLRPGKWMGPKTLHISSPSFLHSTSLCLNDSTQPHDLAQHHDSSTTQAPPVLQPRNDEGH